MWVIGSALSGHVVDVGLQLDDTVDRRLVCADEPFDLVVDFAALVFAELVDAGFIELHIGVDIAGHVGEVFDLDAPTLKRGSHRCGRRIFGSQDGGLRRVALQGMGRRIRGQGNKACGRPDLSVCRQQLAANSLRASTP